jgi:radical SAM superfamily enzyme YgiQ (UPF0313 family)
MSMQKYNKVLLMKVPYCTYADRLTVKRDYNTISPFRPVPSLALASLTSFFNKYKRVDYNLSVVDINIEGYMHPGEQIDINMYSTLLEQYIKDSAYDVLALSAMFIFNVRWVKSAVILSRKYHPNAKIILGGGYPTILTERSITDHDVNAVVIGEGESTFLHLINKFNSYHDKNLEKLFPFSGYGIKDSQGTTIIPRKSDLLNMEELPPPDWDQLNVTKYFNLSGDKILPLEVSRGCPYSCTYCTTHLFWGKRLRYKSTEGFICEMKSLKEKYCDPTISFIDDNATFSKKWVTEFLTKLIDAQLSLKINLPNFSVKHLDEEIIDLWNKAGCKSFTIAVETGSEEMQKRMKKKLDFNHIRNIVRVIKQKDLLVDILWMVGFPDETLLQIQETFNLVRELRAFWNRLSIVIPYPGTEMHKELKQNDQLLFNENDLDRYDRRTAECIKSTEWTYMDLRKMVYDINIEVNFLNNPYLDTPDHREYLLSYLKDLIKDLPDHVIGHIVIGYINKLRNDPDQYNVYYRNAFRLLRDESSDGTFSKYLEWDHYIINDFNKYCASREC